MLAQVDPNDLRDGGRDDDDGRGIPAPKVGDLGSAEEPGTDLELGVRAFLPESYIPDVRMRLDAYRALDGVRDRKSQESVAADLRDRFGRLPTEAKRLLDVFLVKNRLRGSGVKLIVYSRDRYLVDYTDRAGAEAAFARGFRDRRFVDDGRLLLIFEGEREIPRRGLRKVGEGARAGGGGACAAQVSTYRRSAERAARAPWIAENTKNAMRTVVGPSGQSISWLTKNPEAEEPSPIAAAIPKIDQGCLATDSAAAPGNTKNPSAKSIPARWIDMAIAIPSSR